jgi:hypothetical protein
MWHLALRLLRRGVSDRIVVISLLSSIILGQSMWFRLRMVLGELSFAAKTYLAGFRRRIVDHYQGIQYFLELLCDRGITLPTKDNVVIDLEII